MLGSQEGRVEEENHCWRLQAHVAIFSSIYPQGCCQHTHIWDCPSSILHLNFLNLLRFFWTRFSSLPRSLWMVSPPSVVSTAPLSFMLFTNLLRVHLMFLSQSLIKILNSNNPKTEPRCAPFVTGLLLDIEPFTRSLWVCPSTHYLIHQTVYHSNPSLQFRAKDVVWECIKVLTET